MVHNIHIYEEGSYLPSPIIIRLSVDHLATIPTRDLYKWLLKPVPIIGSGLFPASRP